MDAALAEFKRRLLATGLFMKVSAKGQYRCKTCPYCGDTNKHMYVKIDLDSDMPVVCKCHKCNAGGLLKQDWLDYFGIDDIQVPKMKGTRRVFGKNGDTTIPELIDFDKDQDAIQICRDYILKRVGETPTAGDLKAFQFIGNVESYVTAYLGGDTRGLRNRVWFCLNTGNIIGRRLDDIDSFRWVKKNYNGDSKGRGLYVIKKPADTLQTINVCICEGIMDAIGLYYHAHVNNAFFIGCMGSEYKAALKYVIDHGIFGESVNIRIYKDPNINYVDIPKRYRRMFKSISIYKNAFGKDFGVPEDEIEFEKCM